MIQNRLRTLATEYPWNLSLFNAIQKPIQKRISIAQYDTISNIIPLQKKIINSVYDLYRVIILNCGTYSSFLL